jgi:hypothetical protein
LKCDDTRAETRFRLSAKRTSPLKSAGASVQSTTGSRGVRISGSNAGYTTFRGSVKGTGYPLHSPISPSLPHPCVTVCYYISTGLYRLLTVCAGVVRVHGSAYSPSVRNKPLRVSSITTNIHFLRGFKTTVFVFDANTVQYKRLLAACEFKPLFGSLSRPRLPSDRRICLADPT